LNLGGESLFAAAARSSEVEEDRKLPIIPNFDDDDFKKPDELISGDNLRSKLNCCCCCCCC
jgi:hypothetical protein